MLEIYNYIIGIFIGIILSLYNENKSKILFTKNLLITVSLYVCMMSFINTNFIINLLLKLLYFTICFIIINKLNFFQAYYFSLILTTMYLLSYIFVTFVNMNINTYEIVYFQGIDYLATFICMIAFFYLNDLKILNKSIECNIYDIVLIIFINLILFIFTCILLYNSLIKKWSIYFFITFLGFLFISISLIIVLNYCYVLKKRETAQLSYLKMQQLDKIYYQDLENNNEKLCKIKHDYKNHIINLKQLIICKKNDEAIEYIDEISKYLNIKNIYNYCHISYIDSYINYIIKFQKSFIFDINMSDLSHFKNIGFDILIILMNLIDNAIENSTENKISIDVIYDQCLIIKISNYTHRDPSINNFKSSKGKDHGWGLKIINDIIKKYNGETYNTFVSNLYSKYVILNVGEEYEK